MSTYLRVVRVVCNLGSDLHARGAPELGHEAGVGRLDGPSVTAPCGPANLFFKPSRAA